jgi:hypothetical protein
MDAKRWDLLGVAAWRRSQHSYHMIYLKATDIDASIYHIRKSHGRGRLHGDF